MTPLLEVPTDVWLDMRLLPTLPRFVQLPRYDPQAYDLSDVVSAPRLARLAFFHGAAVRLKFKDSTLPSDGALFVDEDRVFVCTLGIGRKGAMRVDLEKLEHVGRLASNRPVKLPSRLDYDTVVRAIQHRAVVARIEGTTVDFELALDPRPRRPGIASATDVLQLLARPIEDRNRWTFVGDSPLATALRDALPQLRQQHEREQDATRWERAPLRGASNFQLDHAYRLTANRFIRSYQLDVTDAIALPALDMLSPEDVRAVLEQRVLAILRVELTDPAWAMHLHDVTAWMHVDERSLPPPR